MKKEGAINSAVKIWQFVIAIAIIGFNIGFIIASTCNGNNGYYMESSNWFFGSSAVLWIFTIPAGFFLVSHFKKRIKDKDYQNKSASARAFEYTFMHLKVLIPVLIVGYILGVLVCTSFYYPDYTFEQVCSMVINSFWEFLGFHAAGLRNSGNEFLNLNGPLWLISALLIVGYFLYWGLCKNEDFMAGIIAPFTFIFLGGWWCFSGTRITTWSTIGLQTGTDNMAFGINNGIIFVLIGMSAGIILYYLIDKIKTHNFTKTGEWGLTILYLLCAGLLLWYILYPSTWFNLEKWTVTLLCIIVICLSILNKDKITGLLNHEKVNDMFSYLGSISLYIYMLHYPIAIFVLKLLGPNASTSSYSLWTIFIPTVILTIVFSMILKSVMEMLAEGRELKKAEALKTKKKLKKN